MIQSCLDLFNRDSSDFSRWLVTINETWIHNYTPESKQQAKQWVGPGRTAPKRAKTQQSDRKVMASVYWDFSGILFIDYLKKEKQLTVTITAHYWIDGKKKSQEIGLICWRKSAHFARQCTSLQIDKNNSKDQLITLRIASPPTLFSKSGRQQLLSILELRGMTPRTEIFIKWRGQMENRWLFWRRWHIVLQEKHQNVEKSLDEVYQAKRGLCWRINWIFAKKVVFSLSFYVLIEISGNMVLLSWIKILSWA